MTQAPVPPPRNYWYLHLPYRLQAEAKKKGDQRVADEFVAKIEAGVKALVRRNPDPKQRVQFFRQKPVELWAEQQEKFPKYFDNDWKDWERNAPEDEAMRQRVAADIAVMILLRRMEMAAQQQLAAQGVVIQ